MKYKVGDKVKAREDLVTVMGDYAGQIFTIADVDPYEQQYRVEENRHYWYGDMLEPLSQKEVVDDIFEQMHKKLDEYKDKLHKAMYSDLDDTNQNKQPEKKTTSKYRDISMEELTSLEIGLDTGESSDPNDPRGLDWFPVFVKGPKGYYAQFLDEFENTDDQHPLRIEVQEQ